MQLAAPIQSIPSLPILKNACTAAFGEKVGGAERSVHCTITPATPLERQLHGTPQKLTVTEGAAQLDIFLSPARLKIVAHWPGEDNRSYPVIRAASSGAGEFGNLQIKSSPGREIASLPNTEILAALLDGKKTTQVPDASAAAAQFVQTRLRELGALLQLRDQIPDELPITDEVAGKLTTRFDDYRLSFRQTTGLFVRALTLTVDYAVTLKGKLETTAVEALRVVVPDYAHAGVPAYAIAGEGGSFPAVPQSLTAGSPFWNELERRIAGAHETLRRNIPALPAVVAETA